MPKRHAGRPDAVAVCLALTACAVAKPPEPGSAALSGAPPTQIVVRAFAADPAAVTLDPSVRPARGQAENAAEEARRVDAETARSTLAATLANRLQIMGLPAQRGDLATAAAPGSVVIEGTIGRIDEGNRTLGDGGGRGVVAAELRLLRVRPDGTTAPLAAIAEDSDTNRTPGLAAGVAARNAALAAGGRNARVLLRAGVSADARRLANTFADRLRTMFQDRGWTTAAN